jgi:hypothetical protein
VAEMEGRRVKTMRLHQPVAVPQEVRSEQ